MLRNFFNKMLVLLIVSFILDGYGLSTSSSSQQSKPRSRPENDKLEIGTASLDEPMRLLLPLLFLWLGGCGRDEFYSLASFSCGEGLSCGDIYSDDLLRADVATIDGLRAYVLNTQLTKRYADTPFKREDDGRGDIDDLMRGLMLVKQLHGINPIFALALSIHESGWGTSPQARGKRNLWGWNAADGKEHLATTFNSFSQGFNLVFGRIKHLYLSSTGRFYQPCSAPQKFTRFSRKGGCSARDCGASLAGMNCKYSSDDGWAREVRAHMNNITAYINNHVVPATGCAVTAL